MPDFDKLGKELLGGENASKFQKIADSTDGQRITKMLDADAVEKAAKSGDTAELKNILTKVLSTEEGKRLAKNISDIMGKK